MDASRPEVPPDALAAGARVYLRRPTEDDRPRFSRLVRASREHLARWVLDTVASGDPAGARWFDAILAANASGRSVKLLVQRIGDDELLGCMNLNDVVRGAFQNAYLGYWVGAPFVRRGYARDALGVALRYAFEAEGLHRVEANVQPGNEPSRRLVEAAGFRLEGFSPRYLRIHGVWRDHERWALTVEDWEARQAP